MIRPRMADNIKAFEDALAAPVEKAGRYSLRLFVTGTTPRCVRAIRNIRAICELNLPGQYDLEVIDIYQNPEQAEGQQIVVTPTLIKQRPFPSRKLIGDLSDEERVLSGLGVPRRQGNGRNA